jgi:hypothetical protein
LVVQREGNIVPPDRRPGTRQAFSDDRGGVDIVLQDGGGLRVKGNVKTSPAAFGRALTDANSVLQRWPPHPQCAKTTTGQTQPRANAEHDESSLAEPFRRGEDVEQLADFRIVVGTAATHEKESLLTPISPTPLWV